MTAAAQFLVCLTVMGNLGFVIWGAYTIFVRALVHPALRLQFLRLGLLFVYVMPLFFGAAKYLSARHPQVMDFAPIVSKSEMSLVKATNLVGPGIPVSRYLLLGYLGCVVFLAIRHLISYIDTRRLLADSAPASIGENLVYLCPQVPGPLCFGIRKTRIYIPPNLMARLNQRELNMIVTHERIHLQNHDLRWKFLSLVLRTLLFFSPAFYLLHRKFELEMEIACDSTTREKTMASIKEYGRVLLSVAIPDVNGFSMSTNMSDSTLKRRIISMKSGTRSRPAFVAIISLIVGLSGASALAWSGASLQGAEPQFSEESLDSGQGCRN